MVVRASVTRYLLHGQLWFLPDLSSQDLCGRKAGFDFSFLQTEEVTKVDLLRN